MSRSWVQWLLTWTLIAAFPANRLLAQVSAPLPEEVLRLVDSNVRYRPTLLSRESDGFEILTELEKLTIVEPSITQDRELYDLYMKVISGEKPFPKGDAGEPLRKLLVDNGRGLTLVDQFVKKSGVRFPQLLNAPRLKLSQFLWVRRLQIASHQSQRQYDSATQLLFEHLHIADMLQDSEGGVGQWLVGSNLEATTLAEFARLASDPECPVETIQTWQERTNKQRQRDIGSLAQCLRREFAEIELPLYSGLAADATPEQAIAAVVNRARPKPPRFLVDLRLTLREWQAGALLSGHPAPFDCDETIRLASQRVAELIRVLESDQTRPTLFDDEEIVRVAELWPESMGLDVLSLFSLHWGGPEWESWEAFWNEIVSAVDASVRLSAVPNALGKYLIAMHHDVDMTDGLAGAVVRRRVRLEARLAGLAIRRFERQHQRLPKTLQDVVDAKLLTELPRDPIDGQPLRYDPARQRLWSIGLDGQDDGGTPRYDTGEKLFSMMRKLLPKHVGEKLSKPSVRTSETPSSGSDLVFALDGSTPPP